MHEWCRELRSSFGKHPLKKTTENSGTKLPICFCLTPPPACLTISKSPPEITLMTNTPLWLVIGSEACAVLHWLHATTLPSTCNTTVTSSPGGQRPRCCIHHSEAREFGCLLDLARPPTTGRHGRPRTASHGNHTAHTRHFPLDIAPIGTHWLPRESCRWPSQSSPRHPSSSSTLFRFPETSSS